MKVAILYVPVIHRGHLEFCKKQKPEKLYLLGKSLINEFPHLERDIRALEPEEIQAQARILNLAPSIFILEKENLVDIGDDDEIIVSDDDVLRELVNKYLNSKKVSYDKVFLRWHKMNSVTKNPVQEDQNISEKEFDRTIIRTAYKEADKSSDWWRSVGVALVKGGEVIYLRHNKHGVTENTAYIEGEPRSNFDAGKAIADLVIFQHGEAAVISEAAKNGVSTDGADIYVTTFPCPTCAMLIANSGIKNVYYREGYSLLDAERILKQSNINLIKVKE